MNKYIKLIKVLYTHHSHNLHITEDSLLDLLVRIEQFRSRHGDKQCIRLIKTLRVSIYQYIAGNPPILHWLRVDKGRGGLPCFIGKDLNSAIVEGHRLSIRMILTVLQVSYIIKTELEPNTTSITEASTAQDTVISDIVSWAAKHITDVIPTKAPYEGWVKPHKSTSAGPLGPALWTAPCELGLLPEDLKKNLEVLGGPIFTEWFHKCLQTRDAMISVKTHVETKITKKDPSFKVGKLRETTSLRRLVAIPAPEGKTRVIAILDYWSQTVLKPLHDWMFDILRLLPNDMTYNQAGVISVMRNKPCYYSYDLSSATDRFPISLQEGILSSLIGPQRASAWRKVLTGLTFTSSWDRAEYHYAAGQPMGAYSSWSTFALCHHVTVAYSSHLAGFRPGEFRDYAILGDDIVIAHNVVAEKYRAVMQGLGVAISEPKSLVSLDSFEFAKRIFSKDKEFTAYPLAAVHESLQDVSTLWSCTLVSRERDFEVSPFCVPRLVADFQASCGKIKRSSQRNAKDLEAIHCLGSYSEDAPEYIWGLLHMFKSLRRPIHCSDTVSALKADLAEFMRLGTIGYYRSLLQSAMREYEVISDQILAKGVEEIINLLPPDFVDTDDESALPIDPAKFPASWVIINEITTWEEEVQGLRTISPGGPSFGFLHSIKVTAVSSLSRVISRRVNKKATAQLSAYVRFLRNKQKDVNTAFLQELS